VAHQAQRLQKLVVDLRWLADLEEGKIEQQPVDLADVLAEAIALAREATHQPGRLVTLQIQETSWPASPVAGDLELLVRRVITLHGGEVSLRSRPQAGTLFMVSLPLVTPG
jgi:signal transduction histidine kinase